MFMKIRIVHTLRAYWLYGIRIKTSRVSVLETYMTSRYMLNIDICLMNILIKYIEIIYIIFRMLYFLIIYVIFYIDTFLYS